MATLASAGSVAGLGLIPGCAPRWSSGRACRLEQALEKSCRSVLPYKRLAISASSEATEVKVARPITFHIGETSMTFPFSLDSARGLDMAISSLLQTFKEKEKATRPKRWDSMEFRQKGEEADGIFVEVFCNPNAHSNAFQAKVLITVADGRLKFTSEGQLSALKADVDGYLDTLGR